MNFTTKDNDNDQWADNCTTMFKGAWWYKACHCANLNALYLNGTHASHASGVDWALFRGHDYSLKRTEMKVKAKV